MKREVRIDIRLTVELDDDGVGVPFVDPDEASSVIGRIAREVAPQLVRVLDDGHLGVGLTGKSGVEVRRAQRAASLSGKSIRRSPK